MSQAHVSIAAPAQLYPVPQCRPGGSHSPSIPPRCPLPHPAMGASSQSSKPVKAEQELPCGKKNCEDLNFQGYILRKRKRKANS